MSDSIINSSAHGVPDAGARVLDIARQLLAESQIYSGGDLDGISLESRITEDLGFDSLARVELFARIDKQLGVTLEEETFTTVQTLADLVAALATTGASAPTSQVCQVPPRAATQATSATKPVTRPDAAAVAGQITPRYALTLVDVLQWHADKYPDAVHIQFYNDEDDKEAQTISYRQLLDSASRVAAGLQALNIEIQQPVAIMLPTSKDYFHSFFAILLGGFIPVPLYPPAKPTQLEDHLHHHVAILNNCRARVLITIPQAVNFARLLKAQVESITHIVTVDKLIDLAGKLQPYKSIQTDIAFLQYTSNSTGNPKGVTLTHKNLLANIRVMGAKIAANGDDVFVSWLPLYHDMGLIGAWFGSLYYGARLVVMSPLMFLTKPQRWLWAIHRYGGTLSAAPNFGYELCLHRIEAEQLKGLDLSGWRIAFNGAEMISPDTLENFINRFKPYGFRREAVMPVYGLAENSVGLTFPPLYQGPLIDCVQRGPFMNEGIATPALEDDANAIRFVSCGAVLEEHEIRVVDRNNRPVPQRRQGHLQFRGPSATSGYYGDAAQTERLFVNGWLNTGDLAYVAENNLYITGRIKDIIIRGGRNIYPDELEQAVGCIEGIRNGRVAAFASSDPASGTERLVVLAETREQDPEARRRLRTKVNAVVNALADMPPDVVVLAAPGTVLKTSSGKLRRSASKQLFESGAVFKRQATVRRQLWRLALASVVPQLRHLRHALTASVFSLYAQAVFWILAPTVWLIVVLSPVVRWRWTAMRAGSRLLAALTFTPFVVEGKENLLSQQRNCIYVANHTSYLDSPFYIAAIARQISFIAKHELSQYFIPGRFLQRINTKFVKRFDSSPRVEDSRNLADCARSGESLFFFPEGTFVREAGLLPFYIGAFVTAVAANVPIVPLAITGAREILPGDDRSPRRGAITVRIGKPIDIAQIEGAGEMDDWNRALKLRELARIQMLQLCKEPDAGHRRVVL